jgi:dTDP-glucose pyrophosphorylase
VSPGELKSRNGVFLLKRDIIKVIANLNYKSRKAQEIVSVNSVLFWSGYLNVIVGRRGLLEE